MADTDETPEELYQRQVKVNLEQIRQAHASAEEMDRLTRLMTELVEPPPDA